MTLISMRRAMSHRHMIQRRDGPSLIACEIRARAGRNCRIEYGRKTNTYIQSTPFNVTRLAGLTTTIIGMVGCGRDEDLVGIAAAIAKPGANCQMQPAPNPVLMSIASACWLEKRHCSVRLSWATRSYRCHWRRSFPRMLTFHQSVSGCSRRMRGWAMSSRSFGQVNNGNCEAHLIHGRRAHASW